MEETAHKPMTRMVYGCFDQDNVLIYIGSSRCGIEKLEDNHRKWRTYYGDQGRTWFRSALTNGSLPNATFKVIRRLYDSTQPEIEALEGSLIRLLKPKYNKDMDPVQTSITKERY